METILLNAIVPIFLIVIFGYLLAKMKLISCDVAGPLMQYVFYAAGPCIIFYAASQSSLSHLFYWKFWLGYILSIGLVIVIVAFVFRFILKRAGLVAILAGFTGGMTNTVIIGYPILKSFTGAFAVLPMTVTVFVFAIVFNPLLIFFFEMAKAKEAGEHYPLLSLIKMAGSSTIKNPMILAAILGAIVNIASIKMPYSINHFAYLVGESIVPVALFSAGLDLAHFKIRGQWLDIILLCLASLVLGPIVGFGLAYAFDMPANYAFALAIFSAVPAAKTVYAISGKYRIYHEETAAVISLTTALAIITVPVVVLLAQMVWPQ